MGCLSRSSNVTELVLHETDETPTESLISMLAIPRALESLRCTSQAPCESLGSCKAISCDIFGKSLRQHKDILRSLDINIRYFQCDLEEHAEKRSAKEEDMPERMRNSWRASWRGNCHLLGSLKDFQVLKALKLNTRNLCGDRIRGISSSRMVESLPASLEELTLYFEFSTVPLAGEEVWIKKVEHLVQNSPKMFPHLRKIFLLEYEEQTVEEDVFKDVETAVLRLALTSCLRGMNQPGRLMSLTSWRLFRLEIRDETSERMR